MNLLNQILFFVLFMYCVILHEVAHGYAALYNPGPCRIVITGGQNGYL